MWVQWKRVGILAVLGAALIAIALQFSHTTGSSSWTLVAVATACTTLLTLQPLAAINGAVRLQLDASSLMLAAGLLLLEPMSLVVATVVAIIVACIWNRRANGFPLLKPVAVLKLVGNVAVQVIWACTALIVFHVIGADHPLARVLLAVLATLAADCVESTALCYLIRSATGWTWRDWWESVRQTPPRLSVIVLGVVVAAASAGPGGPALWLTVGCAAVWLLTRTEVRLRSQGDRSKELARMAQSVPLSGDREEMTRYLEARARDLTHAGEASVTTTRPAPDETAVQVGTEPDTWIVVRDRQHAGEGFNPLERDLLEGLGGIARLGLQSVALTETLRRQALHDDLTGLASRRGLQHAWPRLVADARRSSTSIGLIYIDLDAFKLINDRHGHAEGDVVLRDAATRLSSMARESDLACRIGGDEFLLAAPRMHDTADLKTLVARVRGELDGADGQVAERIRASIGAAVFPDDGDTLDELVAAADRRMYEDKRAFAAAIAPRRERR